MKAKILFVDDEPYWALPYIEELRKDFEVDFVQIASEAINRMQNDVEYSAVVLDVMMPSPEGAEQQTANGLDTGLWLLRQIREIVIDRQIRVLVLTHRNLQYVSESVRMLHFPLGFVDARSKFETPVFHLRSVIEHMLSNRAKSINREKTTIVPPTENQPQLKLRKYTFLSVATEWDSRHGGLSTFNRELCEALARDGHRMYCYVPEASEDERKRADAVGVALIVAPTIVGGDLSSRILRRPPLPDGINPDFVIGHDRQTGEHARVMVADYFKESQRIHFIHTAPSEIEWFKPVGFGQTASEKADERQEQQLALSIGAKVVAAVGPRLHRETAQLLHTTVPASQILMFNPGINESDSARPKVPPANQCLVLGRAEDAELKGLDLAARSMSIVYRRGRISPSAELVVRGAPEGTGDKLRNWILGVANQPDLRVTAKHYTSSLKTLRDDILKASVVLMPSRVEGFGLVGLEAIALGVPVLLSEKSGLAETLNSLCKEHGRYSIVEVTNNLEPDALEWSRQIEFILQDRDAAFARAWRLRESLKPHMGWEQSVRSLCQCLERT